MNPDADIGFDLSKGIPCGIGASQAFRRVKLDSKRLDQPVAGDGTASKIAFREGRGVVDGEDGPRLRVSTVLFWDGWHLVDRRAERLG